PWRPLQLTRSIYRTKARIFDCSFGLWSNCYLCPGDRVAFLLTAQALLQHRAVDDAQQKWFEKCVCSRPVTPHEIHLDLLCHGRDDEESIYRVEHAAFWLMALTLVHDGRLEYDQEFLFTIYIENMLESYETSYSGPQCHVENWEPEEDGVCPICQRRFSEAPPTIGPCLWRSNLIQKNDQVIFFSTNHIVCTPLHHFNT
ncbi:unnamed protein product, partial [Trichogramma brassicae]